jgi:hypothetical protein
MPAVEWGQYLLDYLWEVGPTEYGAVGPVQLSPPAIESWQRQMGIALHPWQFRLLRRLSGEYAAESHMASKPDRLPPFEESSDGAKLHEAQMRKKLDTFLD